MAELLVIPAAVNFVMEISVLPMRAAIITFLDPEAILIHWFYQEILECRILHGSDGWHPLPWVWVKARLLATPCELALPPKEVKN
jgi:hypothetical protein